MRILTINTGSSSVKLDLFAAPAPLQRLASLVLERPEETPALLLDRFIAENGQPDAVAHRVVHGGASFGAPVLLDHRTLPCIEQLVELAPLHNPVALAWIRAARRRLGSALPQVAVFDTAFYRDLPQVASRYALPRRLTERHGLRRYGFHGIAHRALWRRWCGLRPDLPRGGRLISLQLGSGCSITATREGRPLDTSMGFTPLEGLMMATRAGDLDPGLLLFLMRREELTAEGAERMLNQQSGLLGLSGYSRDMRELLADFRPDSRLAVEVYCYRARKYIGAYLAVLGGVDGIVFGGGVGENAGEVRARILRDMEWCGIALDPERNGDARGVEASIGRAGTPVEVWTIPVDEAAELAEEAVALIGGLGEAAPPGA